MAKKDSNMNGSILSEDLNEAGKAFNDLAGVSVKSQGALGDGVSDDTQAFQDAFDEASQGGRIVFIPPGRYLISAPINMKGCSVVGTSMHTSTILANPATPRENWKITHYDNDVALLYAINEDNWSAQNIGIDCQDSYVKGITAFGGNGIVYTNMSSVNSASCAFQFMGSRIAGQKPITNSQMINCYAKGSRWNYVIDGQAYNCVIANNISKDAVNRHISIDPREALKEEDKEIRHVVISNNTLDGRRELPVAWEDDPSRNIPDYAIGTKATTFAIVSGNYISNWHDVLDSNGNLVYPVAGLGIRGAGGSWTNNVIHGFSASSEFSIDTGIEIKKAQTGTKVSGNSVLLALRCIKIDSNSSYLEVASNILGSTSGRYPLNAKSIYFSGSRGEGVTLTLNYYRNTGQYIDDKLISYSDTRPRSVQPGQPFFDSALGYPIWWDENKWVDALGEEVNGLLHGGKIIEEFGDNESGYYIRFADGTQLCFHNDIMTFYQAARLRFEWYYPKKFTSRPKVLATPDTKTPASWRTTPSRDELGFLHAHVYSGTRTLVEQWRIKGLTDFEEGDFMGVNLFAVGRWK